MKEYTEIELKKEFNVIEWCGNTVLLEKKIDKTVGTMNFSGNHKNRIFYDFITHG